MSAGQTPRAWVWIGPEGYTNVAVVVELAEDTYLRIRRDGKHSTYESLITPSMGNYSCYWEEVT